MKPGYKRGRKNQSPAHTLSDTTPQPSQAPPTASSALPASLSPSETGLRPVYIHLPDHVKEMLKEPLSIIPASAIDAVERLQKRLFILENARQFGSSLLLESRIQDTRVLLEHADAIRATPETIEHHGGAVIHENPATGRVEITFPAKYDLATFKKLRALGFFAKGENAAFRYRKIVNGVNVALEAARQAVTAVMGR